jgi:uridine kinase
MTKLIAIGGVSQSGKSTLANLLSTSLDNSVVLHQDDFVKTEERIPKINDRIDWEHPDSIDWDQWRSAISNALTSNDFVIIEGLFSFYHTIINQQIQIGIFLTIDRSTFLQRRRNETRWGSEPDWFIHHVWEAHQKFGKAPLTMKVTIIDQFKEDTLNQIMKRIKLE